MSGNKLYIIFLVFLYPLLGRVSPFLELTVPLHCSSRTLWQPASRTHRIHQQTSSRPAWRPTFWREAPSRGSWLCSL